jgi:hypothetical protein
VAFGLRNMTHKEVALAEMRRVLKPGGKLMVLEFSKVWKPLAPLYDLYSFQMLPRMGDLVTKDAESYRYLAESIRMHPDQETLKGMMESVGFQKVDYFNMTVGVVALHVGYISSSPADAPGHRPGRDAGNPGACTPGWWTGWHGPASPAPPLNPPTIAARGWRRRGAGRGDAHGR